MTVVHSDPSRQTVENQASEAFRHAQRMAEERGLQSFSAWRTGLERRYTVMPPWYWRESVCRQNYVEHIRSAAEWQERQARINEGNRTLARSLGFTP